MSAAPKRPPGSKNTNRDTAMSPTAPELGYRAKDAVQLGDDERAKVAAFLERLDENDDVHRVYAGLK